LFLATPAIAQQSSQADTMFFDARQLMKQKKFAEACELFQESARRSESSGRFLGLGECNEELKRYASAWTAYQKALSLAPLQPAAVATQHIQLAKDGIARVEPLRAHLTIVAPATVSVTRNGAPVTSGTGEHVDPGPQKVVASEAKHKDWETAIDLKPGQTETINVPALEAASPGIVPPEAPPAAETKRRHSYGAWPIVLEVGGGLALGAGAVLFGMSASKWSDIKDVCPITDACPFAAKLQPAHDEASALAAGATAAFIVGGVALAAGLYLHLVAPSLYASGSKDPLRIRF
jgi:hypothetical protein